MSDTYTEGQWARDGGAMPNAQDRWTPMGRIYWCAIARRIQEREQYDSETALAQRLAQEDGRDEPNDLDIAAAEWTFELLYQES